MMEMNSNTPSTIHITDKSPVVKFPLPLFAGDVSCDGCRTEDTAAVGDAVAYAVYLADGERLAEDEGGADHMGDELMGDQDTEVVVDKDCDGDGMAEGLSVIASVTVVVVKAVEE
jgi:hypothetical protein